MRDKAYMGWVAQLPCIICAISGVITRPVEVAHCKTGYPEAGWRGWGISEKSNDKNTTPLCPYHHRTGPDAQHRNQSGDERSWWDRHGIYPPEFCAALYEAYRAEQSGEDVFRRFAAQARSAQRKTP